MTLFRPGLENQSDARLVFGGITGGRHASGKRGLNLFDEFCLTWVEEWRAGSIPEPSRRAFRRDCFCSAATLLGGCLILLCFTLRISGLLGIESLSAQFDLRRSRSATGPCPVHGSLMITW
ncbi:MAG: hypothetical protein IPJ07_05635 [Acidobacteria bacterium]|nr:hypothetical protein [Acidobacteriota bacterium]